MAWAAFLAALLAAPECLIGPARAEAVVAEGLAAERRYGLPAGLLLAVVLAESGGRRLVVQERRGCSAGPAGIYLPQCRPDRLRRLLVLSTNLNRGAKILIEKRNLCQRKPQLACCRLHFVGAYNCGSRNYASRVLRIWRRLRGHAPNS